MKKYAILILISCFFIIGCKKFLDIKPIGAQFLTDLDAVKNTLGAWMYNLTRNGKASSVAHAPTPWTGYQFSENNSFTSAVDVWSFAKWDQSLENLSASQKMTIDRGTFRGDWSCYYELIGLMNLVIVEGSTAKGDEITRDYVLGEAYIQRAYYFLKLLQYYAPIDDPTIGIPVHLQINQSIEEADLSRKPQSIVFDQIIADIDAAELRINRTEPKKGYSVMYNRDWIYRIASQAYLWKASSALGEVKDWEMAARYAKKAIDNPSLHTTTKTMPFDMETLDQKVMAYQDDNGSSGLHQNGYPESLAQGSNTYAFLTNKFTYSISVWNTLYHDGDLRKTEWFLDPSNYEKNAADIVEDEIDPSRKIKGNQVYIIFRLAEQWLIYVEALAMTGQIPEAQQALIQWRTLRYKQEVIPTLDMPQTAEAIQKEVYLERKREFLGESDIIWLDMKLFHVTETRTVQDFTATLQADDFRFQFYIPSNEIKYNPDMISNPGWSSLFY